MAKLYILPNINKFMKIKTLDEKWIEVKEFYELNYRVKFKGRLDDDKILSLWDKMRMVSRELTQWADTPRPLKQNRV